MDKHDEYKLSSNQLIQVLGLAETIKPPPGSGEDAFTSWYMTHKLLPALQQTLPPIKKENDALNMTLNLIIQASENLWVQSSMLYSDSKNNSHFLHFLRWFYIGQFHCLIRNEIRLQEEIYRQGMQTILLIEGGQFQGAYDLGKHLLAPPKRKRGRPAVPFWLKLLMAYDYTLLHCTDINHPEYPNLQPPVADAWLVLDEIAKKYKRFEQNSTKKMRMFQSGAAVRQQLKGLSNLPGNLL